MNYNFRLFKKKHFMTKGNNLNNLNYLNNYMIIIVKCIVKHLPLIKNYLLIQQL